MAENVLTELMMLVDNDTPPTDKITKKLNALAEIICTSGPDTRDDVLRLGAYAVVCRAWIFCCFSGVPNANAPVPGAKNCRDAVLRALFALTPGHPDIIDDVGWQIIAQALDKNVSDKTQVLVVKLLRNVFIKCEANREQFSWNMGMIHQLLQLIFKPRLSSEFLSEWCGALKALILTDDASSAYNKSSDRKRAIAKAKILPIIAGRLNDRDYENEPGTLNSVVILLASMAVTNDLCEQIDSGNVFFGIRNIYKKHADNRVLIRNTTTLLRHLCSSHVLREKSTTFALMKYVVDSINKYQRYKDMVDVGMACCAYMTLHNSCQVAQFVVKNGLPLTMQIMTDFKGRVSILKSACFILRNVTENGGLDGKEKIRDLGFGILLNQLKSTQLELKEFYILPVLKELDTERLKPDHVNHHPEATVTLSDNVPLEPRQGRKSIVLEGDDEEE